MFNAVSVFLVIDSGRSTACPSPLPQETWGPQKPAIWGLGFGKGSKRFYEPIIGLDFTDPPPPRNIVQAP